MGDRSHNGDHHPHVERRRASRPGRSPSDTLMQLPAGLLLKRIFEPALAAGCDGRILFANKTFCDMLGYTEDAVLSLNIDQLVANRGRRCAIVPLGVDADEPVQLMCRDGFVVPAIMRTSALGYHDNAIALVIFKDDLERVWSSGRTVI